MSGLCGGIDFRVRRRYGFDFDTVDKIHVFGVPTARTLYVSSQAEFLPVPPSTLDTLQGVHTVHRPRYAHDSFFYLALAPVQVEFEGPLFDCLSVASIVFEQVQARHHYRYQLPTARQQQWADCERIVLEIQRRLVLRIGPTYLEMTVPPRPSFYGYTNTYESRGALREQLKLALSAFTARMALISYLVLRLDSVGTNAWELLCVGEHPLPLPICNCLRMSWLGDWTVPRVGAFVDIGRVLNTSAGSQWHKDIPLFLTKGQCIPLWFAYSEASNGLRLPTPQITEFLYKTFAPHPRWFKVLHTAANGVYEGETADVPLIRKPYNYCYSVVTLRKGCFPDQLAVLRRKSIGTLFSLRFNGPNCVYSALTTLPPSHASLSNRRFSFCHRQLPNESFEEFMKRKGDDAVQFMRYETTEEAELRARREEQNRSQPVPTAVPPTVYLWTFHNELGGELRTRVPPGDVKALWESTASADRAYNSFRDEYDVRVRQSADEDTLDRGTEAGETVIPQKRPRGESVDSLSNASGVESSTTVETVSPLVPSQPSQSLDDIVFSVQGVHPFCLRSLTTTEGLRCRYGLTCRSPAPSNVYQSSSSECPPEALRAVRMLGWVAGLSSGDMEDIFKIICGESSETGGWCKESLEAVPPVPFRTVASGTRQDDMLFQWTLQDSPRDNLRVAVTSAAVVQFARRSGYISSSTTLIRGLLSQGAKVHIYWLGRISQSSDHHVCAKLGDRPIGVGVFPHDTKLTLQDYIVYERTRHDVLYGPVGVVALTEGGLAWRLALASRGIELPFQDIIQYSEQEDSLEELVVDGKHAVRKHLTQVQEYVIAGVYRILTRGSSIVLDLCSSTLCFDFPAQSRGEGKASRNPDGSIVSWWPLQSTWVNSAMNIGCWSRAAEDWFQRRWQDVHSGKAIPMSTRQWTKALERRKPALAGFFDSDKETAKGHVGSATELSLVV